MKTKKRKSTTIRYDNNHYRLQAIFSSKKYKRIINKYRKKLKKIGLPVPSKGFKNVKDYHSWVDKLHRSGFTENEIIDEIIKAFNIKNDQDQFKLGLKFKIFFGYTIAPIDSLFRNTRISKNLEGDIELQTTLSPYINKQEWGKLWTYIQLRKKALYGKQFRNRERDSMERDIKLYILSLKVEQKLKSKHNKGLNKISEKSVNTLILDEPEYAVIEKRYGKIEPTNLDTILSEIRNILSPINLTD